MDHIWKFDKKEHTTIADSSVVRVASQNVNYRQIVLTQSDTSVFLAKEGMKIGFGSIGKGYAANRAMVVMKEHGINSGMVNAGGDLITWGDNEEDKPWSIGIADPANKGEMYAWLAVRDMAVVTSGDYEKFFTFRNERYGHIIDPRSGYPVRGIKSVTVLCPDAELADALATSVFVMGSERGMALVNQLKGIECLIITDKDQLVKSENLDLNYYAVKH